jgi:hypothetical protein
MTEVICEDIPASIILLYAFIGAPDASFANIFSICMSCISIAVISTSIFFAFDTDEEGRRTNPMFYGAVPDSTARNVVVRV